MVTPWRTPEELLTIGFERSRIVMVNERHHGWQRCVAHRLVGQRLVRAANELGVRRLAMEALWRQSRVAERLNQSRWVPDDGTDGLGYVGQPEMRAMVQTALDLDWELVPYEADRRTCPTSIREQGMQSRAVTQWREAEQARNLAAAVAADDRPLLVWCGLGHHQKVRWPGHTPMGQWFVELTGVEHFAIDQLWHPPDADAAAGAAEAGMGFLVDETTLDLKPRPGVDACIWTSRPELV